jgi:hypothetical protein
VVDCRDLFGRLLGILWLTAWFSMADGMVFKGLLHGFLWLAERFSVTDVMVFYGRLHGFLRLTA